MCMLGYRTLCSTSQEYVCESLPFLPPLLFVSSPLPNDSDFALHQVLKFLRRWFVPERVLSDLELCVSVASYVASFIDALLSILAPWFPHSCCPATSSCLEGASCSALVMWGLHSTGPLCFYSPHLLHSYPLSSPLSLNLCVAWI